jgi:hypothetical protein
MGAMRRALLHLALVVLAATTLGAGGCAPDPAAGCRSSAECSSGTCVDGRCVAPPDDGGIDRRDGFVPRDGAVGDVHCAAVEPMASEVRRPIDVIVLPDESASMGAQRDAVAAAMQTVFRDVMEASGADYKVIWHGGTPLPALADRVVYNGGMPLLGSGDDAMFKPVLDTYAIWSPELRPGAVRVFIHFTDATSGVGAAITGYPGTFDVALASIDAATWGTPDAPLFTYHTFIGLTANSPPEAPWEPSAPLVGGSCGGSFVNAPPLEDLARRTGGLRFPLCIVESFGEVIRRIAESAVARSPVPCELVITPPDGMTIDPATVAVQYVDGAGGRSVLRQAASATECDDASFMLEGDRVVLCPEACARISADPDARLSVLAGCDPALY